MALAYYAWSLERCHTFQRLLCALACRVFVAKRHREILRDERGKDLIARKWSSTYCAAVDSTQVTLPLPPPAPAYRRMHESAVKTSTNSRRTYHEREENVDYRHLSDGRFGP